MLPLCYQGWQKITTMKIRAIDKKRYALVEKRDYQILEKIYRLEKCKLTAADKRLMCFMRTQLKDDWRTPLLKFLDGMVKKYRA